jgi:hypothetical protein
LVPAEQLAAGPPWRAFRWRQGQAHYSGWYWSATVGGHVVYECRLELARLLLADLDPHVTVIAAQPFLGSGAVAGADANACATVRQAWLSWTMPGLAAQVMPVPPCCTWSGGACSARHRALDRGRR